MFGQIFGGKPWFKSMTAWGGLILALAWTAVPAMGELGITSPELTTSMTGWLTKAGAILSMFGIRRAATTKNVA